MKSLTWWILTVCFHKPIHTPAGLQSGLPLSFCWEHEYQDDFGFTSSDIVRLNVKIVILFSCLYTALLKPPVHCMTHTLLSQNGTACSVMTDYCKYFNITSIVVTRFLFDLSLMYTRWALHTYSQSMRTTHAQQKWAVQLTFLRAGHHVFIPSFTAFPHKFPACHWLLPQGTKHSVIRVITGLRYQIYDVERNTLLCSYNLAHHWLRPLQRFSGNISSIHFSVTPCSFVSGCCHVQFGSHFNGLCGPNELGGITCDGNDVMKLCKNNWLVKHKSEDNKAAHVILWLFGK